MYGHIYYKITRPPSELLEEFRDVPTTALSDAMGRHGALSSMIRPIYENIRMVGFGTYGALLSRRQYHDAQGLADDRAG